MATALFIIKSFVAITYNELRCELGLQFNCMHSAIELAEQIADEQFSDDDIVVAWHQFMDNWIAASDFRMSVRVVEQAFDEHRPHIKGQCIVAPLPINPESPYVYYGYSEEVPDEDPEEPQSPPCD